MGNGRRTSDSPAVDLSTLYLSAIPVHFRLVHRLCRPGVPIMFAAFLPSAWSGWQMARRAKSGWEAVFLGAQAGAIAAAVAFLCIIATASEIYAFKPALNLLPTTLSSNQLNGVITPSMIALLKDVLYAWIAVELGDSCWVPWAACSSCSAREKR